MIREQATDKRTPKTVRYDADLMVVGGGLSGTCCAITAARAGIRVVLVQNIGLATIAALIGGGGFGVFVFQGIGQTAMDLVLLGAVPTVVLAFAAAVVLDAAVELAATVEQGHD